MRFEFVQTIRARRKTALKAIVDPGLYESMGEIPHLGPPSVLECTKDGGVTHLRIRYRFKGDLSRAARAVLDPEKMSWVVALDVDRKKGTAKFSMIPDNYADRIKCSGSYRFDENGNTTDQSMEGDLVVRAPLVAGVVEKAIVSGFKEHMAEQARAVERYAAENAKADDEEDSS